MIYCCVIPDIPYMHWQTEVYLTNFLKVGIEARNIHVVVLFDNKPTDEIQKIEKKYPAQFFYYPLGKQDNYRATNWFKGLKYHSMELNGKRIFYHDADMIFLQPPSFKIDLLCNCSWYGSDTKAYTSAAYIISKNEDCFNGMCAIVGIDPKKVLKHENQVCGAQWVMDSMDYNFWDKCERDAKNIHTYITNHPSQKYIMKDGVKINPGTGKPAVLIQKTAAMWSILWNAWLAGKRTQVSPEMSFVFATAKIERSEEVYILHNAGVSKTDQDLYFPKIGYTSKSPIGEDLSRYSKDYAAWKYVQAIGDVK